MALLDAALVCAGSTAPPATLKQYLLMQLDFVGPVIVLVCFVFIALEIGVWMGVVKKSPPGQPPDWDDDDD